MDTDKRGDMDGVDAMDHAGEEITMPRPEKLRAIDVCAGAGGLGGGGAGVAD